MLIYSEKKRFPIGKLLLLLLIAGMLAFAGPKLMQKDSATAQALAGELIAPDGRTPVRDLDLRDARIVMYSLTTCIYCRELRHIFEANRVPFREYFIDEDPARMEEFQSRLLANGVTGGVGTPTLEVNGVLMINNPPVADILHAATGGIYKRRG